MEQSPQSPFFINERKHRCASRTVIGTFRMLTRQLGLASTYGREPRLHDLRHTWATRCLAEIYESGQDPNAVLPALATYLRHVNIACTTIYLHPDTDRANQFGRELNVGDVVVMGDGPQDRAGEPDTKRDTDLLRWAMILAALGLEIASSLAWSN